MFQSISTWFADNLHLVWVYFGILALSAALWSSGKMPFEDERSED